MGFLTPTKTSRKILGGAFQNLDALGIGRPVVGKEFGNLAGDIKKKRATPKSKTGGFLEGTPASLDRRSVLA